MTKLLQIDLEKILEADSDRALFKLLHESYTRLRTKRFSWMSLRVLDSVTFVNFDLYKSELVDIRK